MTFGMLYFYPHWEYYPAEGWVNTVGLNGKKSWTDSFYGQGFWVQIHGVYVGALGVIGFTGLKYGSSRNEPGFKSFYFGSALRVKLGSKHPPYP